METTDAYVSVLMHSESIGKKVAKLAKEGDARFIEIGQLLRDFYDNLTESDGNKGVALRNLLKGTKISRRRAFYWIEIDRVYESELPPELTELMDRYLRVERQTLLARGTGDPARQLWISRWGTPLGEAAIRTQIEKRTEEAFGKHVWPHLFRTIAATGFVDFAPEKVMMVANLLGHTNIRTSEKYYILANGARAHKQVQDTLRGTRAAARVRMQTAGRKGSHG